MKVAIILPVHNEEAVLKRSVERVHTWAGRRFGADGFRLVISENGSFDGTRVLARALLKTFPDALLVESDRPGKGGAIKRGAAAVEADAYLFMDIDLATELDSAERLIEAVRRGADLAIGSRRCSESEVRRPALRRFLTKAYADIVSRSIGFDVRDAQCGCKAFSRRLRDEILSRVGDERWFFDTELLARTLRAGLDIEEIGVRWNERHEPGRKSKVRLVSTGLVFLKKLADLRRELEKTP